MNKYIPIENRYGDKLHFFIDRARKEIEKNLEKYSVQENLTEKQIETAYELYQEAIITVVAEIVINKREHTRACKENLEYKKFIEYVFKNDEETGQLLLSGMGELHLEVIQQRLKREFGLELYYSKMRVNYHETIEEGFEAVQQYNREINNRNYAIQIGFSVQPSKGFSNSVIIQRTKYLLD